MCCDTYDRGIPPAFGASPDKNGIIYGGVIVLDLARGAIKSSPSVTLKHDAFHLDW